jgi:Sodium:neurotransmitter symporter family
VIALISFAQYQADIDAAKHIDTMTSKRNTPTRVNGETWSGRLGFILATVGSAVGIGSIWKFPYEVGANGGSAFVFFYLLGLFRIVVPLMLAEFAIGRRGVAIRWRVSPRSHFLMVRVCGGRSPVRSVSSLDFSS